jgi:hypothetical protein
MSDLSLQSAPKVSWPLRLRENLGLLIGSLARTEPVGASVAVAGRPRREFRFSVHTTGSLDVLRYGQALKARRLVGVRGAGRGYDGLYYVKSVTSTLKRGEFKQNFSLVRDGLISLTPTVPT